MSKRKYDYQYWIASNYGYGWEDECPAEDLSDAKRLLTEYISNCGGIGVFKIVKRRITA